MTYDYKKKLLIIFGIFIFIVLIVSFVFILFTNKPDAIIKDTSLSNPYIDPGSGETIYSQPNKTPEKYNNSNQITYLGFSKLVDTGLTSIQLDKLKVYLDAFSLKQNPIITEISLTVASINQNINQVTSDKLITFEITTNRTSKNNIQLKYTGINDLTLIILDPNNNSEIYNSSN